MYLYEYEEPRFGNVQLPLSGFGESGQLRQFAPNEIELDDEDTRDVLKFFWPDKAPQIDGLPIDVADRGFAQGLLVEAIDASYTMGTVEEIYKRFFMKVPTSFRSIVRSALKVARRALQAQWFRRARDLRPEAAKIYENVRVTLARNFRSPFEIRLQTGSY